MARSHRHPLPEPMFHEPTFGEGEATLDHHLSDARLSTTSNISMIASCVFLPAGMKTKDFQKR